MNFDDPKITAYALGELDSAEDRAFVEQLLKEHPELATELEETRAIGSLLRRELKAEEAAPLAPHQREHVLQVAEGAEPVNGRTAASVGATDSKIIQGPWWKARWVPSTIAATVILSTGIALLWEQQQPKTLPDYGTVESKSVASGALRSQSEAETSWASQPGAVRTLDNSVPTLQLADKEVQKRLYESNQGVPQIPGPAVPAEKPQETRLALKQESLRDMRALPEVRTEAPETAPAAPAPAAAAAPTDPAGPAPAKSKAAAGAKLTPVPRYAGGALAGGRSALTTSATPSDYDRGISRHMDGEFGNASGQPAHFYRGRVAADQLQQLSKEVRDLDLASGLAIVREQNEPSNTESYDNVTDNAFLAVKDNPLSTFSIDVDTASYANVRRFLMNNQRPPKGAVRIEELVNYFPYSYTPPAPESTEPFSVALEASAAPWSPNHRLVRVALKGREIAKDKLPPSNLVFLIDVSGSMDTANKLPLVRETMLQLVEQLREQDTVGIVVYAGSSGTVLEPTSDKAAIRAAVERLQAGGSTNGAAGIQGAYDLAQRAFKKEGNNRVILATDGDFNVGVTNQSDLVDLIQRRAKSGVFLSVLGFGMGNVKDSTMEKLADKGNGNYAYIDSLKEGRKVLVEEMSGTLFTIAKDVKIQVEFNPAKVGAYRLIGYENRILAKEDFNDDTKDAGEVGAGHTVTALYEVVPAGQPIPVNTTVDPLKYQQTLTLAPAADASGTPADTFTIQPDPATPTAPGSGSDVKKADPFDVQKYLLTEGNQTGTKVAQAEPATRSSVPAIAGRIGGTGSEEMLTLKLRYKAPDSDTSTLKEFALTDGGTAWSQSTPDFRWAAAVASFGMLLRDSPHRGNATWDYVAELARDGKGEDRGGYRTEFISLVDRARQLVPVTPLPTPKEKTTPTTENKAARLILPEFDAADLPVVDVIDLLSKKSKEVDPEKTGVPVVYSGPAANGQLKVSFRMRNISVLEAARTLANIAGLKLEEQSGTLHLKSP